MKKLTNEDIALLSYTDLTYIILNEESEKNTKDLFSEICKILNYNENDCLDKIGDYYTSLTLDKRFVLLDNGCWDISERHAISGLINLEEEIEEIEEENELEEEINIDREDVILAVNEVDEDDLDLGLEDLTILTEEDIENEIIN